MNVETIQEKYEQVQKIYEQNKARRFDEYMKQLFPDLLKLLKQCTKERGLHLGKTELLFLAIGGSEEGCLLVSCLLEPKSLILVHSKESEKDADAIESAIDDAFRFVVKKEAPQIDWLCVDAYDPQSTYQKIVGKWADVKDRYSKENVAIDITFGTKMMSIGALLAAIKIGLMKSYYLDGEYDNKTRKPKAGTNFYREFTLENLFNEMTPEFFIGEGE